MIHGGLVVLYAGLPALAAAYALWRWRVGGRFDFLLGLTLASLLGAGLAVLLLLLNGTLTGGSVHATETVRLAWLITSGLIVVRILDVSLGWLAGLFLRRRSRGGLPWYAQFAQRAALALLLLPLTLAAVVVYRPAGGGGRTPDAAGLPFEAVEIVNGEGLRLAAWWLPAQPPAEAGRHAAPAEVERRGRQTVVLCHGFASGKEESLAWAATFVLAGYNVLAFDFRAHGQSEGRLCGLGAIEGGDALAAVRWVRENRPESAQQVHAVGIDMGAVAALEAAVSGPDLIDSLVMLEPYGDLGRLARTRLRRLAPGPLGGWLRRATPALISAHLGVDIDGVRPERQIERMWPRPVLIVFGRDRSWSTIEETMSLNARAAQPKSVYWPSDVSERERRAVEPSGVDDRNVIRDAAGLGGELRADPDVQLRTLRFIESARRLPVL